jgi:hypothetical protein
MAASFPTSALVAQMRRAAAPLAAPRRAAPARLEDDELAYARDAETYALTALLPGATVARQARALLTLLTSSRHGLTDAARSTLSRVTAFLCAALPADVVLTALLAARRARANHKHLTRVALRFVLDHPHAEDMVLARTAAVRDVFEHVLGREVARGCARRIAAGATRDAYLARNLYRWTQSPPRARALVREMYRELLPPPASGARPTPARALVPGAYATFHAGCAEALAAEREYPKTITADNRGDIAATLVRLYRGADRAELGAALSAYVARAAASLPQLHAVVGLVLDASLSTRGHGDRAFACISQSVALRMVLERCTDELRVAQVGGAGDPPVPGGASDLAMAVLDLLEPAPDAGGYRTPPARKPDVILVVTDGYENRDGGDLARVLAALGDEAPPVVICTATFTAKDDLALRRVLDEGTANDQVRFWHEDDFGEVLLAAGARVRPEIAVPWLRAWLAARLVTLETETMPWMLPR